MDILPSGSIFRELQIIHETGCFSSESSFEDQWQQPLYQHSLNDNQEVGKSRNDLPATARPNLSMEFLTTPCCANDV
uniref:Uncharacterized protein n=1 Tax=Anopheles christyi TaxID=43041 RepID=A0A182K1G0_9DIPT